MTKRFAGKTVLVTGAASGMGRATALRFAEEGASVFGLDVDASGLSAIEASVKEAGGTISTSVADVTDRGQCFEAVKAAADTYGQLDVLANVAGIVRFAHSHEMPEAQWNLVFAVNVNGPFFLCQAAIPHLLESGGSIVNVASNAGIFGQAYTTAYSASKHALIGMSKSLAMEYMRKGIRINVVAPGGTNTPMNEGLDIPRDVDPKLMARYTGMRGFSDPADIASAVAYLASDEAGSIHGAVFSVDNGITAG